MVERLIVDTLVVNLVIIHHHHHFVVVFLPSLQHRNILQQYDDWYTGP